MTHPMLRQLRHDVWATDRLIAHCRQLSTEQLQLSVPGTESCSCSVVSRRQCSMSLSVAQTS